MSYNSYINTTFGVPVTVVQGIEGEVYSDCPDCDGLAEVTTFAETHKTITHDIDRAFAINVGQHTIQLQSTFRRFSCEWRDTVNTHFHFATKEYNVSSPSDMGSRGYRIQSMSHDLTGEISENCTVTHTTILYLDTDNGVALTREITVHIGFTGNNSYAGRQYSVQAQAIGGADHVPEIIVTNDNVSSSRTTKYVLYKHDGSKQVVVERSEDLTPATSGVPDPEIYGEPGPYPDLPAIANLWQIIIPKRLPEPLGTEQISEWNAKVYGFYGYTYFYCAPRAEDRSGARADGGEDFFYPMWIRNLIQDPFWLLERDMRTNTVCDGAEYDKKTVLSRVGIRDYIDREALPYGSYAIDAEGNYFYSFTIVDNGELYEVNSINGKDPKLPEVVTDKEKQYSSFFPIGVI